MRLVDNGRVCSLLTTHGGAKVGRSDHAIHRWSPESLEDQRPRVRPVRPPVVSRGRLSWLCLCPAARSRMSLSSVRRLQLRQELGPPLCCIWPPRTLIGLATRLAGHQITDIPSTMIASGPQRSLASVATRLRCHRCGKPPSAVYLHRAGSGSGSPAIHRGPAVDHPSDAAVPGARLRSVGGLIQQKQNPHAATRRSHWRERLRALGTPQLGGSIAARL